jgi:Domain of unknown function (DUF5916)
VLRFSSADVQSWGVQVHRNVSRKREQMMWSYKEGGRAHGVSHFGHIVGLRGLRPQVAFELRPYAMARVDTHTDEGGGFLGLEPGAQNQGKLEAGLDAKIGLTSRLTLDLTVNPDFGQVEADQVVLNLSRFETFFPEKRPFFLEGRDLFETPIQLFYPRRIGRLAVGYGRGNVVYLDRNTTLDVARGEGSLRLWSAAKLTGEVGDNISVATLGALTGAESVDVTDAMGNESSYQLAPERSYAVGRGRYAIGDGDFAGVTATAVNRLGGEHVYRAVADHDAYAQAADFAWASENGRWRTVGQAALSERVGGPAYRNTVTGYACTEDESAVDDECIPIARANGQHMGSGFVGYGAQVHSQYVTKTHLFKLDYTGHSPKFDVNDAGFAPRFDIHELKVVYGWSDKEPGDYFNYRGLYPFAISAFGFDGTPQYALLGLDLEAMTKGFLFTSPEQWILMPKTSDPFETLDGAHFENPPAWEGNWEAGTNPAKRLAAYLRWHWFLGLGDENRSTSLYSKFDVQATSNIELSLEPEVGIDHSVRFFDCNRFQGRHCLVDTTHHYLFGDLDSKYFSTTFRGTITIAPPLSFQGYAQLFMDDGDWSDFKQVDTMGTRPTIQRSDLLAATFDYDGSSDFKDAALNVNLVLRWEVDPGSTLFLVYTRSQASGFQERKLDTGPTEDVMLVKFVYYASK